MKRKLLSLGILITALVLTGCTKKNKATESTTEVATTQTTAVTVAEEEAETSASNKIMVAEALGIEISDRAVDKIVASLDTIGTGKLQSAVKDIENGEVVLNIVAEDAMEFRLYLSASNNVEAALCTSTNEWVLESDK